MIHARHLLILALGLCASAKAQLYQKGNYILADKQTYGYLNCHMSDRGQWTAYATLRRPYCSPRDSTKDLSS